MTIESLTTLEEATAGSERPIGVDTGMSSSSALLSESMAKRPFALFFASTGMHEEIQDDAIFVRSVYGTPLLSDEPSRPPSMWISRAPEATRPPETTRDEYLAKANYERVALLARKYVAKEKEKFSDEENARLAIVTERVRKLLPAVTVKEYEALEGVLNIVQEARKADKALRERVGMPRRKNA